MDFCILPRALAADGDNCTVHAYFIFNSQLLFPLVMAEHHTAHISRINIFLINWGHTGKWNIFQGTLNRNQKKEKGDRAKHSEEGLL